MDIPVGSTVRMKKAHPCGSREFEVIRIGADFKLKCRGCGTVILLSRARTEKNVKEVLKQENVGG